MIKDKLLVKAPFHHIEKPYPYVIEIEPKMSFGTGHHETTSNILELMMERSFEGESVLDMGSGTGILAIFARILGASEITAIDIDDWAYENCIENVRRNNCPDIKVLLGDVSQIPNRINDIVIANINRNVLLADMVAYAKVLKVGGLLYLSGFYVQDIEAIQEEAKKHQLILKKWLEKKNWAACIFEKES
jgi:ribosomal protein L11 methyltransferase